MKKFAILLLLIFTAACAQSVGTLAEEDFAVTIKTKNNHFNANTEIQIITALTNKSKQQVKVWHASPLFQIQIYNEQNHPLIDVFSFDQIGLNYHIEPGELYDPSKIFENQKKTIVIKEPGTYRLVSTAYFSVELNNGERREFKISSEPYEVMIK